MYTPLPIFQQSTPKITNKIEGSKQIGGWGGNKMGGGHSMRGKKLWGKQKNCAENLCWFRYWGLSVGSTVCKPGEGAPNGTIRNDTFPQNLSYKRFS